MRNNVHLHALLLVPAALTQPRSGNDVFGVAQKSSESQHRKSQNESADI